MAVRQLAAELRDSHASRTPRRIIGRGTWLDAGRPVRPDATPLAFTASGITDYVPGDLTLTALGGTTLQELHGATRVHGQRLALDPYGGDAVTIGATVATASAGPAAGAFGTPRDQVLGVTFVTGTGDVVQAGGRVVKNVAGFDLVRLTIGAWGTLGVVAEVSVRLRAIPAADVTLTIPLDVDDAAAADAAIGALRALPFTFEAAELVDDATAAAIGLDDVRTGALLLRATGTAEVVHAMRASLAGIGTVREGDPASWDRLRTAGAPDKTCVRLSHAPAQWRDAWHHARRLALAGDGMAHMSVARTVARVHVRSGAAVDTALASFDGTVIGERMPAASWEAPWVGRRLATPTTARLARGIRDAFDPARILNPGILGSAGGEA